MRLFALCGLVLCASGALAARVEIPLRVPLEPIRQALSKQLAASPSNPNVIYSEGRCRYLNLETPKLDAVDGHLRLTGPGSAALGVELFGQCQNALAWTGSMQFGLVPRIDNAGRLRLRIVDSRLADAGGASTLGFIWDLTKRQLHPRLERFSYDLGASRAALLQILRGAAPPERMDQLAQALQGLEVLPPRVEPNGIVVPVAIEFPDAWLAAPAPPPASSAPLTEAELEALERALQPWDAFLVYSVKQVALDSDDAKTHVAVEGTVTTGWPCSSVFGSAAEASMFFESGSLGYSATHTEGVYDGLELRTFGWSVMPLAVAPTCPSMSSICSMRFSRSTSSTWICSFSVLMRLLPSALESFMVSST